MRSLIGSLALLLWSISSVNAQSEELGYAAIRGWYNECQTGDVPCKTLEEFYVNALYLDFVSCYTNPNMDSRSVSFLGRGADTLPVMYNLFFTSAAGKTEFSPTNCDPQGKCECTSPTELGGLRGAILEDATENCKEFQGMYQCTAVKFEKKDKQCLVPASTDLGVNGQSDLICAMVADIALLDPSAVDPITGLKPSIAPTPINAPAPTDAPDAPTDVPAPTDTPGAPTDAPAPTNPPGNNPAPTPFPTTANIPIPEAAQSAYCTAIVGWYNSCAFPNDEDASWCQAAIYTPLDTPKFIDLTTCYVNPYDADKRSVSFFGESTDKSRILEFHLIILTDSGESPLLPTDCKPDGTCTCPIPLLEAKAQFLANGGDCLDTKDYSCLSEDFYGSTEDCFIPATYEYDAGPTDLYCSMIAKLEQYGPCETMLDIPPKAYDAHCTAITGWYNECEDNSNAAGSSTMCDGAELVPLEDDLVFIDLESCYSNPNMDGTGVSFYGRKDAQSAITQFHILAASSTGDKYKATNCTAKTGVCECTQTLRDLKTTFLQQGSCSTTDEYTCQYDTFEALDNGPDRCYAPATRLEGSKFTCSMVASIESFFPCDTAVFEPTPEEPAPTPADLSVVIPDSAHEAYCTAIVGWHNGCTETPDGVDFVECNGTVTSLADNPLFIDFNTCYINPAIGQGAVSMYGNDATTGVVKGFHMIFLIENGAVPYRPMECEPNGACVCSDPLIKLKEKFLELESNCDVTADYLCTPQSFEGDSEDCYIPTFAEIPNLPGSPFVCTMAAQVQQFQPCNVQSPTEAPSNSLAPSRDMSQPVEPQPTSVNDIPATAKELGYTAITGWWNKCATSDSDRCADATQQRFENPVYLNLDTCYSNPNAFFRSVSFFLKGSGDETIAYHLLFESSAYWATMKPSDCTQRGECTCETNPQLQAIRESIKQSGKCQDGDGYLCTREVFSTYNSDCYVPAQQEFMSGEAVCAMAATLEQIVPTGDFVDNGEDPGEAEFPTPEEGGSAVGAEQPSSGGSSSSSLDWWAILLIVVTVGLVASLATVYVVKRRRRYEDPRHDEEDVWIRTDAQRDSRFTRRPLNTDDAGDGVWKKEGTNLHDLNFTVT